MRTLLLLTASALALIACTGQDPNLTETGKGKPYVTVAFPESTEPGGEYEAVIEIQNPGPEDMRTVVVAFATIAPRQGQQEFPSPIVGFGSDGVNPSVVGIDPEPSSASPDGVIYTFGPDADQPRLLEGESMTITFTLKVPITAGVAANSVQVYEGSDIDRVAGVRMETLVGR